MARRQRRRRTRPVPRPLCPRSASASRPARVHPAATLAPSAPQVAAQLRALCPSAVLHGTSSCRGCITNEGQQRLGLLGIHDPHGRYASGLGRGAAAAATAREAGRAAARSALANAGEGVLHEMPSVALINGAPGAEEEVLRGVEDVLGSGVIAVGGSCADDAYDGSWWCCSASPAAAAAEVASDGVAVTVLWPSVRAQLISSSCFEPTAARGVATRAEGRVLWEVDGVPAAEWYARHGDADFGRELELARAAAAAAAAAAPGAPPPPPRNVLDVTTLGPLGRRAAALGSDSLALAAADLTLVHPARLVPFADDPAKFGLENFASFEPGDAVVLMGAQRGLETLETHPQNVMGSEGLARGTAGCLVVYCAGCALKIEARLQRVAEAFSYSLERPFVGMFTYGEQFRTRAGANQHANLMYAVLAFGD